MDAVPQSIHRSGMSSPHDLLDLSRRTHNNNFQLTIADLLRKYSLFQPDTDIDASAAPPISPPRTQKGQDQPCCPSVEGKDPVIVRACQDVVRMMEILKASAAQDEVARTRLEVLEKCLQ